MVVFYDHFPRGFALPASSFLRQFLDHFHLQPHTSIFRCCRAYRRLANSVSAGAVELLKQKHAEELQGLRTQAARAQELETELTKARGVESLLRLEFDCRLAKEQGILSVKYDSEVDELCASLESKVEGRDAEINELKALRKLDSERHDKEIGIWRARDRKL
jgi:hypothetical protein